MDLFHIARIMLDSGLSIQEAARAANLHRATAAKYRVRLTSSGLDAEKLDQLSKKKLYDVMVRSEFVSTRRKVEPDWTSLAARLSEPEIYATDLYNEYSATESSPLSYATFRRRISAELKQRGPIMRIPRVPGEEGFVDFAGKPPFIVDPDTGKKVKVELFVATLGHSRLTFVCAVKDQTTSSWLRAHVDMFRYWGGVPKYIVPDNLKAGVTLPRGNRKGFKPNSSYASLSDHYHFLILPARPRKPTDKGSVEAGVKLAKRWIVLPLRSQVYTSLGELNAAIRPLLERLNNRPMRGMGGRSRRQIFEAEEKSKLRRLSNQVRGQLQNVSYQFQDVVVQISGGTSAFQALGQQMPQLLGGFGAFGAALGLVSAIAIPLAGRFLDVGDAAKDLKDNVEALEKAVRAYNSAQEDASASAADRMQRFGSAMAQSQALLDRISRLQFIEAVSAVDSTIESLSGNFSEIQGFLNVLDSELQQFGMISPGTHGTKGCGSRGRQRILMKASERRRAVVGKSAWKPRRNAEPDVWPTHRNDLIIHGRLVIPSP
ncbi:IS21 family transposase [Paracoccus sulfuroxidans]|uniref:Transposase n=1 Tax=Paracoccus sulfuroxidans TaxID=384678 RepID=A0A562NVB1_9RHOB|nr:IS21 family transposase [Paracoccus sulfuroxidans]TWI35970.1 transposase [Paracoccus sulfuroxidans]